MDISPLTVLIGAIVAAAFGYAGIRYQAKRGTSGGTKETPADTLWRVMTGRVELAEAKADRTDKTNVRLEEAVHELRGEIVTYRNEQVDARRESIDKERASLAVIEGLEARVLVLEGQLTEAQGALTTAMAEVKSLRQELGKPTGS